MEVHSTFDDFQIIKKIGEGAFGIVYKVKRNLDAKEYALKKVTIGSLQEKQKDNALNQVRLLASLDSPYVIAYKQAFFQQDTQTLNLVMEYAESGDLSRYITEHRKINKLIQQSQIWKAVIQIALGLKALHEKKIIHRDLKSANIFIDANKNYKIGDLNVSKVLKNPFTQTQTGTPFYASPQIWRDQPYDIKSDIWSLGCIIYQMATYRPPFDTSDLQVLYRKVQACKYQKIPSNYSNDLWTIINLLIKPKACNRPTALQLLTHQIVRKHGIISPQTLHQANQVQLLKTIRIERDFKWIQEELPKSNYQENYSSEKPNRKRILSVTNFRKNQNSLTKEQQKQVKIQNKNNNSNTKLPPKPQNKSNIPPPMPFIRTPQNTNRKEQRSKEKSASKNNGLKLPIIEKRRGSRDSSIDESRI